MKNLKSILLMSILFIGFTAFAGNEKAIIKTSAQCDMCKTTLEANIGKILGVSKVMLKLDTKELIVKFDSDVTNLDEIKAEITYSGYWADDKAPNKESYAALPSCCKPKKSCCASKSSCSKDAGKAKTSCSKDKQ